MTDPKKHAQNVERLADRLRDQGVPVEHEEGVVVITGSDGHHHETLTMSEDGVSHGHDVVLDPIDPNRRKNHDQ